MVEKDEYNKLSKRFFELKQQCISLELAMQLNKEIFQKNNTVVNQTEPTFDQLFELNNLKAEFQAKDTTIKKLKANIKCFNKTSTTNSVKKDIDEIETINIELEHKVLKLITKNEHLKQTYKQLHDSIKPSRVRTKEHTESLVNQLNQKSVKITDLNAQLQEKFFVITTLKNDLRKLKGKDIVDNAAQVSNATTIAPGMYKLDPVTLASKDKNNRKAHIYYLKHTMEQDVILREIVKQAKSLNPLDSASYSACKHVKLIQELLGYVRDTCPDIHKPSEKLVTITPINMKKTVSSMFDARHELCFLKFVSDMNASSKSKSVKKVKKKEEWKPIKKITATNKVPLREHIPLEVVAQESIVTKVYTRRPKENSRAGSRETSLYTLSIGDMMASSPICLLSKASKTKSCKKQLHKPKSEDTNQEKLYLLHMDLCGPMRVASINGKKYILIIMDDYSRFTWVKFLASKDKAPDFIIKFLKMIQVRLNAPVRNIHTNNGTKFVNQTLRSYYKSVGISHETSVARSPQQNGVVERRNHSLVEAARTIKPDISYLHVFGALFYPNNDSEDLGKLQAKADIGIFIGYAPKKKAYHIYNRRPGPQLMTPATSSSGLVTNPIPQQPCNPPIRDDWDRLF
ncbi:retrovirus-related pol polyprotein from transposon TNT 1-94 [Tanacetum coccineum]